MSEQAEHIERVGRKIGETVLQFCMTYETTGAPFTANQLTQYVRLYHPDTAVESPMRILRQLKERGFVSYECISRKDSQYTIINTAKESET